MKRLWLLAWVALSACHGEPASVPPFVGGDPGPLRVVSLAPHLTELMYSAGAGDMLVGVIEFSDYPAAAAALPRVGDAFRVDQEQLAALAPDLILAWEGGNPRALIDDLRAAGYRVETFRVGTLEQVTLNLRRIGRLTGRVAQATAAANGYAARLAEIRAHHVDAEPLDVFFQTSAQPIYTINARHAISEAISLCGGVNVFAQLATLSASVSVEAVIAANPAVMLCAGDASYLDRWRAYPGLRAVDAGHLFGVEADLITRDSLRILGGVQQICAHLDAVRDGIRKD